MSETHRDEIARTIATASALHYWPTDGDPSIAPRNYAAADALLKRFEIQPWEVDDG